VDYAVVKTAKQIQEAFRDAGYGIVTGQVQQSVSVCVWMFWTNWPLTYVWKIDMVVHDLISISLSSKLKNDS